MTTTTQTTAPKMRPRTAEGFHEMGLADHKLVTQHGNHYAKSRHAQYAAGTGWQSRAYIQGWTEGEERANGHYEPAVVWMRTPHAERVGLLARAKLGAWLAGRAFADIGEAGQKRLARAMAGDDAVSPVADGRETMGQLAARVRMVDVNRKRAEALRRKFGYIASMDSVPLSQKLQGPRHAPGLRGPNGERVARSHFKQVFRQDECGNALYFWQWAAFDEYGSPLQVLEMTDLWSLRDEAAYQVADGSRFVRSHRNH